MRRERHTGVPLSRDAIQKLRERFLPPQSGRHGALLAVPLIDVRLARLHEGQEAIRELRASGMTLAEIAVQCGVYPSAVQSWVSGRRAPPRKWLNRLKEMAKENAGGNP